MATSFEKKPRLSKIQPCVSSSPANFTTLACKANATFDMQHQLGGNIAQEKETQKGSSCTAELGAEETTETAFTRRLFGGAMAENEDVRGSLSSFLPSPDLTVEEFARTWTSFLAPAPRGAKVTNERTSSKQRNAREGGLVVKSFDDIASLETDNSSYDNVAPCFEELEKEYQNNDLFEDISTSIDTRDTNEEKNDPRGKPDVLADSSVVYRPPSTAGTRNVTSAPEMNGFLTWPFGYSGWNRAPTNPRPTRKTNRKLGAAQRLGLIDDDIASMGSIMGELNSSSSNSSREPDFHCMKAEAHSGDDFSDAPTDLHDSKRGYECTNHASFSQALDGSTYASNGNGEWEIVSVLDRPYLYDGETGTVDSQALQDFLDDAGSASFNSISDSGDRSASDDSVGQVDEAIAKFKRHALLLGVDEKDLLLAIQNGVVE
jgi:hypothetical protein